MKNILHMRGQALMAGVGHLVILALVIIAGATLLSPLKTGRQLKKELEAIRSQLNAQEVLYPLYIDILGVDTPDVWPDLRVPARIKLSEPEVVSVPDKFIEIASRAGVEIGSVKPVVQKDDSGGRYLSVEVKANGSYEKVKDFLMGAAQMPSLVRMARLELRREELQEQINLQAHLALE